MNSSPAGLPARPGKFLHYTKLFSVLEIHPLLRENMRTRLRTLNRVNDTRTSRQGAVVERLPVFGELSDCLCLLIFTYSYSSNFYPWFFCDLHLLGMPQAMLCDRLSLWSIFFHFPQKPPWMPCQIAKKTYFL